MPKRTIAYISPLLSSSYRCARFIFVSACTHAKHPLWIFAIHTQEYSRTVIISHDLLDTQATQRFYLCNARSAKRFTKQRCRAYDGEKAKRAKKLFQMRRTNRHIKASKLLYTQLTATMNTEECMRENEKWRKTFDGASRSYTHYTLSFPLFSTLYPPHNGAKCHYVRKISHKH